MSRLWHHNRCLGSKKLNWDLDYFQNKKGNFIKITQFSNSYMLNLSFSVQHIKKVHSSTLVFLQCYSWSQCAKILSTTCFEYVGRMREECVNVADAPVRTNKHKQTFNSHKLDSSNFEVKFQSLIVGQKVFFCFFIFLHSFFSTFYVFLSIDFVWTTTSIWRNNFDIAFAKEKECF